MGKIKPLYLVEWFYLTLYARHPNMLQVHGRQGVLKLVKQKVEEYGRKYKTS